ncbi:LOW QUALITY PROTEIN: capping protein-inhibiting regulator of actin dynamics [Pantherophis guttatus]|uniref:LOW QUALITY PROTEIN: capping protein-inhibiting regulator of actin dynamics n=1 Tax=Pantherophis guttatus TaxID=94885 RepID=A0ABM3ZEN3_PANGU|nr:LOW QUALITY PROTEIN: capping protein-inhibiting regulator of actin dynamics [Pantherophis guttatus]
MINLLKKPYKKKGSKFQPFKKLFGRRKKRETTPDRETTKLKASSSFGNVCNGALSSDEETNSGLRSPSYSMGTRAFSHESIFMPDGRAESEESIQAMSQDNLVGKVKTLQQQLAKNIKFGQPSQMTVSVKTPGEASGSLEADVLLNNPMETVMPPDVVLPENHHKSAVMPDSLSPTSLGETSQDRDEKVTPVKVSSRPKRHHSPSGTIETVNLDAIPLPTSCLDNSAAKHKLSVRPKNQRVSKKHRLSKEVQSLIETDFGQDILESQGTEDKVTKDDSYYRPDKLTQHGEVHEQKTEGKRKQDHWIHLEAGKKEQMAETKFKSPMEHKRLQEFEGSQGEQVGKKLKLQEEQLYEMEEKKDQDHQEKELKERERQGRNGEGPEKLQAQIPKKSQDLEEQKQTDQEQAQHELEVQRQQEQRKPREMDTQWQKEKKKKQQELEAQRQQEEQKRHELELQRQREEEQKRQRELELQRQQEVEQKRQRELELHRQREEEQKRHELELQRQREEEQKRHELELQRQREEEQKRQRELVLQRQREEEQKRQRELELQREREEEQKRHELELQRQREEEQKRHELELQRQREVEQKRQRELELQKQREEEQKRQRELEQQKQREEEQKRQRELELQRQREEEQKRQRELEIQRQREEEAKRQGELEIQRQRQEEQKWRGQETQRQQEEKKKQYEQEEQKHKDCTIQKEQKVKDPKEEKRHQETELNDNLIQQGWKEKKEEPEKQKAQEEKISHPYLEKQKMKELKTVQTEKLSELNQQLLPEQKREIGQKKKEQENSKNLDDRNKLQEKAMKLKGQEEQQQNLNEKQFSTNEQKQQKSAKSVGSTEHSKIAPAETGHLRAEEEVQQEEFTQRTESEQLERHKILSLEDQQSLEKPKEEKKSHQLHMKKHQEDEHLETVEKELLCKEEPRQQQRTQPGKEQKEEGSLRVHQAMNVEVEEQGRVLGEELRWQEVDARQTMSRGFTFQVSSGEKEIIFPKVNLSPVTPMKEAPLPSATKEFKDPNSSRGSSSLPTSSCVPHTAILVTGAQLCGTAVNLNQIKDTACKSLLGLTEEKKAMEAAQTESIQKPVDGRPNSTKAKHIQDAVDNQAILDEWASIRSKILKGAENDKFNEKDSGSHNRHSDDWTAKGQSTSHGNLRKTLSANAKFSITPAWQKFSEISKTAAENKIVPEAENAAVQPSPSTLHSDNEAVQTESPVGTKNVGTSPGKIRGRQEVAGNTEGCKFAKDLPSFLVPSLPYSPNKELSPSVETSSAAETQHNIGSKKLDRPSPGGEENVSPFGVKLRRTNYSLRFHYDQQAEQKKKKRYSAGDSFDGLPTPLTPDNEQDAKPLFLKDSKSLSQDKKDARLNSDNATLTIISRNYTIVAPVSSPTGPMSAPSQEKSASKSPLPPKPALAPKPISQTPPTSPLTKPRRSHFTEPIGKRVSKVEPDTSWRKSEGKGSPHPSQEPSESKNEEEESREKKSFFPSITMPWREKAEKKPEPLKKERPVLQSRHSIDGSKVMEKGETAQPLWITLALQKQKGFREQQATREERRQAREAKQAEKLAKENASVNNQADNKSNNVSRSNILQKSTGPEEEKKMETATSRFERREQFKKSNTLPSSVTVEITDSLSSSPLAKEVTKRFSTPDANPVSTEPAWLALAKRKAKAWSDCPQIIKSDSRLWNWFNEGN